VDITDPYLEGSALPAVWASFMKPNLSNDERVALRRITIVMLAAYPVLVVLCAGLNLALVRIFSGHPLLGWAELFYGPALLVAVVWAILAVEIWIRPRLRRP
jgi:hypothetical protein